MKYFFAVFVLFLVVSTTGLLSSSASAADDALNAAANQAFMAANAKKPNVVSLPSGLQYRILHSGFGNRPAPADTVQIDYSGQLINGRVFDGSSPGLPVTLAVSGAIKGLNEALLLMHQGDRWQLLVPPDLAFGTHGSNNGAVPPNQAVIIDVTLLSIISAARVAADTGSQMSLSAINRQQATSHEEGAMLTIPQ